MEVPHPLDANYALLKCKLEHLPSSEKEFSVIEQYFKSTAPTWSKLQLTDIWRMDREGEVSPFH